MLTSTLLLLLLLLPQIEFFQVSYNNLPSPPRSLETLLGFLFGSVPHYTAATVRLLADMLKDSWNRTHILPEGYKRISQLTPAAESAGQVVEQTAKTVHDTATAAADKVRDVAAQVKTTVAGGAATTGGGGGSTKGAAGSAGTRHKEAVTSAPAGAHNATEGAAGGTARSDDTAPVSDDVSGRRKPGMQPGFLIKH